MGPAPTGRGPELTATGAAEKPVIWRNMDGGIIESAIQT
jgi:hypothetical protein